VRTRFAPLVGTIAAVGVVTAAVFLFREVVPVLSLGVLYLFAVLPVALLWGRVWGVVSAVASMLASEHPWVKSYFRGKRARLREERLAQPVS